MARNAEALKVRVWGDNAGTLQTPEAAGLVRDDGWPDGYGIDQFPPLGVFNQVWREFSAALVDIAQYGILPWDAAQRYEHDPIAYCIASDERLYASVQSSGGSDISRNPILDTARTYWRPVIDTTSGRIAAITNALLEEGTDNDLFVTAAALLSLFKAAPNDRWHATPDRFGLTRYGTKAQIEAGNAGRAVNGDVLKQLLDDIDIPTVPNSSTTERGLIRTATTAEARAGTASGPAVTPAGVAAAIAAIAYATTAANGVVRLATVAEAQAGTDTTRVVTPAGVAAAIAALVMDASETQRGTVLLASQAQAEAGTNTTRAVTPAGTRAAIEAQVVELVDETSAVAQGEDTHTVSNPTNYRWFEFLVPEADETHYTRLTRAALGITSTVLYGSQSTNDNLYSINPSTGAATLIGSFGVSNFDSEALVSHDGLLLVGNDQNDSLYSADPSTGAATLIGAFGVVTIEGLASHSGVLYAIFGTSGTQNLYSINPSTGAATSIGALGVRGSGLTSHNNTLYMSSANALYSVDPSTGAATLIGNFGPGITSAIALASHSGTLLMSTGNALYSVDPSTGAATLIGNFGVIGMHGLASHMILPRVSQSLRARLSGTTLTIQNNRALPWLQVNGVR